MARAVPPALRRAPAPSISADGSRVAFFSFAANLVGGDNDTQPQIFVRDIPAGTTTLASRADGPDGASSPGFASSGAISGDGNRVAFFTSQQWAPGDGDNAADVFVRDLPSNRTILVSRGDGADGANAPESSGSPSIDHTGNRVAFQSLSGFESADAGAHDDVYVRDLGAGTTRLVSRATGGGGAGGDAASGNPSISADGRRVAFETSAANLVGPDANSATDVFVRDLEDTSTTLASRVDGAGVPRATRAPSSARSAATAAASRS